VINTPLDFGACYQTNDPTSENLNDILPTDGGVITIHGTGNILKLFPVANGMLVFATNGIWFITGSQGIGFAANDYTITQISKVKILSGSSFVDVLGLPFFWNEEGIYEVVASQQGQLTVNPITVGTILTFFNTIPVGSKQYAKGAYDPISYILQWTYRSTTETGVPDRYNYDSILNYSTYNKAFFPYSISPDGNHFIQGVDYVSYPFQSSTTPEPGFKYPTVILSPLTFSFAEEFDTDYLDWGSENYDSFFVTGYKVHGKGQRRFQVPYLFVYSRTNEEYGAYYIQSLWDYAITGNSGLWSTKQFAEVYNANRSVIFKRHRLRGNGMVMQIKVSSVDGQPFDIIGWSVYETQNSGV
jgi:hypothetical protein